MVKSIIKGDDLMLFDSTGKSIGWATSHTLTISADGLVEVSTKDNGPWKANEVTKISWEVTSENLYSDEEYDALFSAMLAKTPITVYFGKKTAATDGKNVADDDFAAWSLSTTANVAKSTSATHGSYSATGTATGKGGYVGSVLITSLVANANTGEAATFSVTLTGNGQIKKIPTT